VIYVYAQLLYSHKLFIILYNVETDKNVILRYNEHWCQILSKNIMLDNIYANVMRLLLICVNVITWSLKISNFIAEQS